MAKKKTRKLHGEVLAFFQEIGSRGGKTRAKKYSPKQLSAWARKGGRPPKGKPKESAA